MKMDENKKSSLKNPFAEFNASLMDDEEIIKYWIQPQILFERQAVGVDLTGNIPVMLEGGRGMGKTMLLKFMSNEVRVKKYFNENNSGKNFLKDNPYIGVYYRFDGPSLSSFADRHTENVIWETLFKHYFEIVIGQKYIAMLLNLKKNGCLNLNSENEKNIVLDILRLINPDYDSEEENSTLESLIPLFQKMADKVFQFINELPLSKKSEFKSRPIIRSGKLIFGIPQIFADKIPEFRDKKIIILLDEYENLLSQQQKIINTLIKHVQRPVTFRIGTRLHGFKTFDTLNKGEFLMEDADYRKILFEDILLSHDKNYKDLLKKIAKKRLESMPEFKKSGLLDISELLRNLSPIEEALNIVGNLKKKNLNIAKCEEMKHIKEIINELKNKSISKAEIERLLSELIYPKNPLIEMLNLLLLRRGYKPTDVVKLFISYINNKKGTPEYKKYNGLYNKNEIALLFQLISLYRPKQKMYAGFNVFSMLTSGIIRNFLELCYQSFNISLFSEGKELLEKKQISFKNQTEGAEIRAEKFFKTIERIPEYGNEIKSLVRSLGAVFSGLQKDPRLKEPEVTYFCVDKTSLSEKERKILDTAVQWSVLQEKGPMKGKSSVEPLLDVYALNHILAPYFKISYRLRGRIPQFYEADIKKLMLGKEGEKKSVIRQLSRLTDVDKNQLTLFDFWRLEEND
jgi:hypothetical protein